MTASLTSTPNASSLLDFKSGVTLVRTSADPYLALPDGRVLVVSPLPASASGTDTALTASTLQFGGNSGILTRSRLFRWETLGQVQVAPENRPGHRIKLAADARFDETAQDVFTNQLGTFGYASLGDLAANRPASFTRTLTSPTRVGGDWNAFLSAGDLWRATSTLQLIYGLRADANHFTETPAFNRPYSSRFGLRTDDAPNSIDLSPRLGFTWQATRHDDPRWNGSVLKSRRRIAIGGAVGSTGLAGSTIRLSCVGSAVPTPDWHRSAATRRFPPRAPVAPAAGRRGTERPGGRSALSPRPKLALQPRLRLDDRQERGERRGVLSLNGNRPGTLDDNFLGESRFTLGDEGRAVFVPQ